MQIPDPFTPIAISAGLLINMAYDILKHRAQVLDSTLVGRMLKWGGLIEPNFDDHLRDTLSKSLELYFKENPQYELTGVESFFRDAEVGEQIGNFILDGLLPDQQLIQQALDRHLGNDFVAKMLIQKRGLGPEHIIFNFMKCYRTVLREQLDAPQMCILLEIVEQKTTILDAIRANDEKMKDFIVKLFDKRFPSRESAKLLTNEEIDILRQEYCSAWYERWKMLDFRGIMHIDMKRPMGIPLTEVFICPDVLVGVPEHETVERLDEHEIDSSSKRKLDQYRNSEQEWIAFQNRQLKKEKLILLLREDLSLALARNNRLVILGDPGAGKSTLLHYLILLLTHEKDLLIKSFPQLADALLAVPLYMPLASYAEVWSFNIPGERSLKDFIPKYLQENYPRVSLSFIQNQLEQGSVFLLFDGLDEIPDASLRSKIVRQIEVFTQSYPQNRYIITSRCKIREETQQESGLKYSITHVYSTVRKKLWRQKGCCNLWNDQRFTI